MKNLLLLFSLVALLSSCGGNKSSVQTFATPIEVAEAKNLAYINNSFTGVVRAAESSNIAFKTGGQIIKLNVEEGDKVKKGSLIAEIDPIDYRLKLEAAKAAYIRSKSQLDRFTRLVERSAISRQEFEGVEASYANDKANYENAQSMLAETKIYAPFNGIIEKRFVDNFQRIQPSEPVVSMFNPNRLEMRFTIPESIYPLFEGKEQQYFVRFEAYPSIKFKAKLTRFVNSTIGGGFPVTVEINDPLFTSKYNVKPGFTCTIYLEVSNDDFKDLVSIPATSILASMDNNNKYVWLYNSTNSEVVKKEVKIYSLYGTDNVIVSGIAPGDTVVRAGIYSLVNNQKVKLIK